MKLFYTPGACSVCPHVTLQEAGLPHELVRVDLRSHKTEKGEDYYAINPKGYVPGLQLDDGQVLTENTAIVQYLADKVPDKGLIPSVGSMERYRVLEWLGFVSTEIHKTFSPLFNRACTEETRKAQLDRLANRFEYVAKHLEGREYLMGDRFTVADSYLFAMLNWTPQMGPSLDRWPTLKAYYERVLARPAVRKALVAEGLIQA